MFDRSRTRFAKKQRNIFTVQSRKFLPQRNPWLYGPQIKKNKKKQGPKELRFRSQQRWWNSMMYIQRLFLRFTSAPTQSVIYDQNVCRNSDFLWNGRKSPTHSYDRVYDIRSFVKQWPELLVRITSVVGICFVFFYQNNICSFNNICVSTFTSF